MLEFFLVLVGLAIIAFAIYGIVAFVSQLKSSEPDDKQPERRIKNDVVASAHLLNHLYQRKQIGDQQYRRLRDFLDKRYGNLVLLPPRLPKLAIERPVSSDAADAAARRPR